jgi:hypothetical protein
MRKVVVLGILIVLMAFTSVNAQDLTGKFNVSPFAGIGIPTGFFGGDLEDGSMYRKMGFKFGGYAEYFFTPNIGAGLDFMYATFGAKDVSGISLDDKFNVMMFGAHGKFVLMPESTVRPYGIFGIGMVSPTWKDFGIEGSEIPVHDVDIDAGMYISGNIGVMYFVSPMISIFAEAGGDYLMLENANASADIAGEITEGDFGENLSFIDFRVGVNIWFGMSE